MSDIESRIDKLERTINELRNELRTLRVLVRTDYPSALNKIRFITEKILGQLCKEHNISWGTAEPTLENMIGPLISKGIIPRPIAIHVRSIQTNSSPGSHFQEAPLSATHLEIAQMALVEFLEWYYSSHPNAEVSADAAKPTSPEPSPRPAPPPPPQKQKAASAFLLPGCLIAAVVIAFLIVLAVAIPIIIAIAHHRPGGNTTQTASTQSSNPPSENQPIKIVMPPINAQTKPIADLCDNNETRFNNYYKSNNFLKAISVIGEYQLALLDRYPAPTFNNGLFQSDAHNISCNLPDFADWKTGDTFFSESKTDALRTVGMEYLLSIQGPTHQDNLGIISADFAALQGRMGNAVSNTPDQNTILMATQFFAAFGKISGNGFVDFGTLHALPVQITPATPGPDITGAAFQHNGVCYVVVCTAASHEVNQQRLDSILSAITFNENPDTVAAINQIKQQITSPTDVAGTLTAVRDLALLGQFRPASQELSTLAATLAGMMPTPVVEGDVATDDTYGIRIRNPDPSAWELSTSKSGVMNMMSLQAKHGDALRQISVIVLDPILTYGPKATEMIGPTTSESDMKTLLQSAGVGGILNTGASVESDDFTKFKGLLTYEITGINPAFPQPNMREKELVSVLPNYCLLIVVFAGTQDEIAEDQATLDHIIDFRDEPLPPG